MHPREGVLLKGESMFLFLIIAIVAVILVALGVDLGLVLSIALLAIAICFFPPVAAMIGTAFPGTALATLVGAGSYWVAGLAVVASYMVDSEVVESVIDAAGEIASSIAEEVVDVASTTLGSVLTSKPVLLVAGALGILYLLGSDSKSDNADMQNLNDERGDLYAS
jgi:hypothetical protein